MRGGEEEGADDKRLPNRIRLLRKLQHLSSDELARMIRPPDCERTVTGATVRRLEIGRMTLTLEWMHCIAQALGVDKADLLWSEEALGVRDDAVEIFPDNGFAHALLERGIHTYKVLTRALEAADLHMGSEALFNQAPERVATVKDNDIVLVTIEDLETHTRAENALRIVSRGTLHTTGPDRPIIHTLADSRLHVTIKGVFDRVMGRERRDAG